MVQINTPYPATAYLTGFLRKEGYAATQADLSLELMLALYSRAGLEGIKQALDPRVASPAVQFFLENFAAYSACVETVIRFLQGRDPAVAHRINRSDYLPQGLRFRVLTELDHNGGLEWAFGENGDLDRAKFLGSLFVDDLNDVIREGVDPHFELSRYGERLALAAVSFDPLLEAVDGPTTLVEEILDRLAEELLRREVPTVIGVTVPFPGNLYGALRIARVARRVLPEAKLILGGGYVNTELRELSEARLFDFFDYVTLDDGEAPFLAILRSLKTGRSELLRTFVREGAAVSLKSDSHLHDIPLKDCGTPTYDGLAVNRYVSLCEMVNPMHRLWSDGWWNKLTLAHGCYWKRCTFCDTSLDYIANYQPQGAKLIVDRMEALMRETGQSGFHFVDEAAPPALLSALSDEITRRELSVTWWTNIRFERNFSDDLVDRMARSGCIAVTGGLEVAENRLLKLMDKGVTVEQVAAVTARFAEAGIMVHAYLMYGFPSQTEAEIIEALERVRGLFAEGSVQSAFWHRFAVTIHSPIGRNPEKYGIELRPVVSSFAQNDIPFVDSNGIDYDRYAPALRAALYNYMHGIGLDDDVRVWFRKFKGAVRATKSIGPELSLP